MTALISLEVRERKPILLIDDSPASQRILDLFAESKIDFVKYDIRNFEESCCGELPTTKAPSVIAAEGIFKDEPLIINYIDFIKTKKGLQNSGKKDVIDENNSSYW